MMHESNLEKDLANMFALISDRNEKISEAENIIDRYDPMAELSQKLHPSCLNLLVDNIKGENSSTRTYRLINQIEGMPLPYFRAGQYISLKPVVDNVKISRPYTISSSPTQSERFYDITISLKESGFFSEHVRKNWKTGTKLTADGPHGNFYYEPLRDRKKIVAIAGGSGITPFRSMLLNILENDNDLSLLLIYGNRSEGEIIFKDELDQLALEYPRIFNLVYIISEASANWRGHKGFISGNFVKSLIDNPIDYSYFICGPEAMHLYCLDELAKLGIPRRLIRREIYNTSGNISSDEGFNAENKENQVTVSYSYRNKKGKIKASTDETILTSLERAGLEPKSHCRSGECGFCRTLVLSGEVKVRKEGDGRRAADLKYGFIHPCSTYPTSDLVIDII